MALPELDVARVRRWCAGRVPEDASDQLRIECELAPRHLTIVERHPPWHGDVRAEWSSSAIARLRYLAADKCWKLYWSDRHQRFHVYAERAPSRTIDVLLAEIDRDPSGIFWG